MQTMVYYSSILIRFEWSLAYFIAYSARESIHTTNMFLLRTSLKLNHDIFTTFSRNFHGIHNKYTTIPVYWGYMMTAPGPPNNRRDSFFPWCKWRAWEISGRIVLVRKTSCSLTVSTGVNSDVIWTSALQRSGKGDQVTMIILHSQDPKASRLMEPAISLLHCNYLHLAFKKLELAPDARGPQNLFQWFYTSDSFAWITRQTIWALCKPSSFQHRCTLTYGYRTV